MKDEQKDPTGDGGDGQHNRMATGIALGIPFGVLLSLLLDNWGMVGVGVALGVSFGLLPPSKGSVAKDSASEDSAARDADRRVGEEGLDPGEHR
jgi:hypothetical protein